ncbi:ImmA/IrrE family metallo-endopeptidase [Aquibacillus sediminis]|uniref:ImmA/IrrE family metallo-endopeptidase n=1 Tax=Aquibacillus sediminis TaxID=2574734 RepID=UPI0014869E19|nr:ImmA/IrrE family metallo-endopeptidase [Aquibacillus sediminis]
MPEITFQDLPRIMEENKEIRAEINMMVNQYFRTYHPKGWNRIDGARKFIEQHHYLIEAPVNDATFGGFIRTTHSNKHICYINTAQPRMYQNFVLFHELFHLISLQQEMGRFHLVTAELDNESNERKADYFASLMLMDEHELKAFFTGPENKGETVFDKTLLCMFAFKAPYKAVLIRLFELNLISRDYLQAFFDQNINFSREFARIGKDQFILETSKVRNFRCLETLMEKNPLPTSAQASNIKVLEDIREFFSVKGRSNDE